MTGPRRPRAPTAEDRALWDSVAKTVAPLKRTPRPVASDATPTPAPAKNTPQALPPRPREATRPTEPPRLAPLDRRLKSRIGKGVIAIDARVDLHGLTQAAAHRRLHRFLDDSQATGARLVLVITGKGRTGDSHPIGEGRGILKRLVPMWLSSTECRRYVVGYEPAGRTHGGEGALYVRIRNRRKAGA